MPAFTSDHGDDESSLRKSRMIFKAEVLRRVGCTYATLWRWMRAEKFPLSFDVGGKTGWLEHEVENWLRSRPRSNLKEEWGVNFDDR
jgi:predicted DNA-binding transcriptional regulator AlpA